MEGGCRRPACQPPSDHFKCPLGRCVAAVLPAGMGFLGAGPEARGWGRGGMSLTNKGWMNHYQVLKTMYTRRRIHEWEPGRPTDQSRRERKRRMMQYATYDRGRSWVFSSAGRRRCGHLYALSHTPPGPIPPMLIQRLQRGRKEKEGCGCRIRPAHRRSSGRTLTP